MTTATATDRYEFTDIGKSILPEQYRDDFLAHLADEPVPHQHEWSGHGAAAWRAPSGSMPMSPALSLKAVIEEFGITPVTAVSHRGAWIAHDTTGQPGRFGDYTATYTILGVRTRKQALYFLDAGANIVPVLIERLPAPADLITEGGEVTATTAAAVSVSDLPGHPADGATTRAQIGMGVLMSCGARDFVRDDPNGLLMFRVGPNGKRLCKVLIRLRPDDTYTVEYGRTSTDPFRDDFHVWRVVEQEHGVYAEQLPAVVRRLGDRDRY